MSEQETRIEELERPAEALSEQAAEEVRGGTWTLAANPSGDGSSAAGPYDTSTRQTRQSSIVVDM